MPGTAVLPVICCSQLQAENALQLLEFEGDLSVVS